jgi:plasmid stability protein
MAQLLVRGLKEEIVQGLRARAAAHGRSVEAEHRAILEEAVRGPHTTADAITRLRRGPIAKLDAETLRDHEDTGRRAADTHSQRCLVDFIGSGKGVHKTRAAADKYIRGLRKEWQR